MKIDFIIISGLLVIISFLPFILFPILIGKERIKLKNKFKEEASKLGLNISYNLSWNTNLAGLDILKKQFLLVQNLEDNFLVQQVNLNKVFQIKMATEYKEVLQQEKLTQTLFKVVLEFHENSSEELKTVNLFDNDLNYIQDFEIKNAQRLITELQKYLIENEKLKRTA